MTCIDCGKIDSSEQSDGLYICPKCWQRFRKQTTEQQFKEMIRKTGGTNGSNSASVLQDKRGG